MQKKTEIKNQEINKKGRRNVKAGTTEAQINEIERWSHLICKLVFIH